MRTRFIYFFLFLFSVHQACAQKFGVAENAMVVAPTPEAAAAGVQTLKSGGNAIDAAVAAAFALMVTDPAMCSVGGRAQILVYLNNDEFYGIDGATQTPRIVAEPAKTGYGYKTCPIPGSPVALQEILTRFGSLPFKVVLQPAIKLAKEGFLINQDYHETFRKYGQHFREFPGTSRHFLKTDGSFYSEGDRFIQPTLANTLEKIAEYGALELYFGELAELIVKDMVRNGGLVTRKDLQQYRFRDGEIVSGNYHGFKIISRGDQCDGGSVIEMLQILENYNVKKYVPTDSEFLHILAQSFYIGSLDEKLDDWIQTSKNHAARRAREIDLTKALPVPNQSKNQNEGHTNHVSVLDSKGNAVSITQSIGPTFGSKVVNPELGFFYAYSYDMNNNPIPYQREKTSQSPTIVLKNEKPFLILGSAGSSRITTSIVQCIVNVLDFNNTLEEAVLAPRLFLTEQELRLEAFDLPKSTLDELKNLGYKIRTYDKLDGYFGRVQAILFDHQARKIYGASDPRDFGAAIGF